MKFDGFSLFVQIHLVAEYGFQEYSTLKVIWSWQMQHKHFMETYNNTICNMQLKLKCIFSDKNQATVAVTTSDLGN